jgi:hypothetical protein
MGALTHSHRRLIYERGGKLRTFRELRSATGSFSRAQRLLNHSARVGMSVWLYFSHS